MVTESKTSYSREAKKEKPEAFPDTPKELLATIKKTAFNFYTCVISANTQQFMKNI